MTAKPCWKIDDQCASLEGRWAGQLDFRRLADGLRIDRVEEHAVDRTWLAALIAPHLAGGLEQADWHHRGGDLAFAMPESETSPLAIDALWCAASDPPPGILAQLDVIVSVRTRLIESWPELIVVSRLPADEVLRLSDPAGDQFEPLAAVPAQELRPQEGPGCLLFRLLGGKLSYAEMVYPPDFEHDHVTRQASEVGAAQHEQKGDMVRLQHRFFARRLEKGVVLRCRLRGVFVRRADDAQHVAACFRAFAAEEPFLGT